MTTKQQEELREEFRDKFVHESSSFSSSDKIADYWLSKIDLAIAKERQRFVQSLNEHGFIANIIDDELHILSTQPQDESLADNNK